jgi:hypothetical protein
MLIFPLVLAGLVGASYVLVRTSRGRATERQICLFLTAGLYLALLEAFWPLITKQDFLPSTPMVTLLLVAAILTGLDALERGGPRRAVAITRVALLASMCTIDLIAVCRLQLPWRYSNALQDRTILATLRATHPGEPILDIQGETIFRPRPFYYLLEDLTVARLANGSLRDDIRADIVLTRTHFVVEDSPYLPPGDRPFLNEHFVSFGGLRVLGSRLRDVGDTPHAERSFDVCYAERFAVDADGAPARGILDGVRYRGPVLLQPGAHRYRPESGERDVIAVWDVALERKLFASGPRELIRGPSQLLGATRVRLVKRRQCLQYVPSPCRTQHRSVISNRAIAKADYAPGKLRDIVLVGHHDDGESPVVQVPQDLQRFSFGRP